MATKIPVWAKGYLTVKNGVIAFVVICVMILVFMGVGLREWKKKNKEFNRVDSELKRLDGQYKQKSISDSLKIDSLEKAIDKKQVERVKEIHTIHTIKERQIEKIDTYNADSIRAAFRRL